jgi:hypothetical protein
MIGAAIARRTRRIGAIALASVATLGLTAGPSKGIAQGAPGTPDPPSNAGTLYGDPAAAAPFWHYQDYDDDCVEMAVADVIGELSGYEPSERAIVKLAQSTPSPSHRGPIYAKPGKRRAGSGTSFDDEPALLAHYGVQAVSTDKSSAKKTGAATGMKALEQGLAAGHKMIVGLNAELIWREPVEDKTSAGEPEANHAVVVTGVDTATGVVHLNDSGSEDGRNEQIPIDLFVRSWDTSDDQLTVTS